MSIAIASLAFSPAEARLSEPSKRPSSLPVFSNMASIATVPPRPSVISAVAAPSATLKPANQISWSTWTVVVAADGSGAIDSTAIDAAASDCGRGLRRRSTPAARGDRDGERAGDRQRGEQTAGVAGRDAIPHDADLLDAGW